jgi:hypothetical protein
MKRMILALAIGIAAGYNWGYGEGTDGKTPFVSRTLERFGTSKVKAANDKHNKSIDEAGKP